jgi:hypothetical protein
MSRLKAIIILENNMFIHGNRQTILTRFFSESVNSVELYYWTLEKSERTENNLRLPSKFAIDVIVFLYRESKQRKHKK